MKFLIIVGSIIMPIIMLLMQKYGENWRAIFTVAAIIAALIFGDIAAVAIYEIIEDKTVFMTNVHAVFLNSAFLITGAYLGVYAIYQLFLLGLVEYGRIDKL